MTCAPRARERARRAWRPTVRTVVPRRGRRVASSTECQAVGTNLVFGATHAARPRRPTAWRAIDLPASQALRGAPPGTHRAPDPEGAGPAAPPENGDAGTCAPR